MHKISLEKFEGPLDLLLQLIEKNKLKITEISLADITDQYLEYIENIDDLASEEVADFLLIASKLIYIKSKDLLPDTSLDDDGISLEDQLKIYRQYYDASKYINTLFLNKKKYSYTKKLNYKVYQLEKFVAPKKISSSLLHSIFKDIIGKIEKVVNIPKIAIAKAVSIKEKIKHIQDIIKKSKNINFNNILNNKDRTEILVSFLAMLELVKQKEIAVSQDKMFGDLNIYSNKE